MEDFEEFLSCEFKSGETRITDALTRPIENNYIDKSNVVSRINVLDALEYVKREPGSLVKIVEQMHNSFDRGEISQAQLNKFDLEIDKFLKFGIISVVEMGD